MTLTLILTLLKKNINIDYNNINVSKYFVYAKIYDSNSEEFTLDDERKTEIGKEAIVMYSRQESVGCKFQEPEDPFGSPLGNYVMADFK